MILSELQTDGGSANFGIELAEDGLFGWDPSDVIDGGDGHDALYLTGQSSGQYVFTGMNLIGIEEVLSLSNVDIVLDATFVPASSTIGFGTS